MNQPVARPAPSGLTTPPTAAARPSVIQLVFREKGGLMISRLPTPSFKSVTVYAENVRFVIVGFVGLVAALLTFPWETMVIIDVGYIAIVLKSVWLFRKNRKGLRGL